MHKMIGVKELTPSPNNNRTTFDLDSLSASIKEVGIIEPLVVRETDKGYQIVCGERRWRAAKKAKLTEVPCIVRELNDEMAFELTLAENMERDDLSCLEEAAGVQKYLDKGFNKTQIAAALGRSIKWVSQRANLTSLAPCWVDAYTKTPEEHNEGVLWHPTISSYNHYPVTHLEEIAALPEDIQEKLFKESHPRDVPTLKRLREQIADLSRVLKKAPFPLDWAEEGKNGKGIVKDCESCPMRMGANPDLFGVGVGIAAKDDICNNGLCYKAKARKWEAKKLSEAKAKARAKDKETANADLVLHMVDNDHWSEDREGALRTKGNPNTKDIVFFRCKKADEGARQGFYNNRLIYVRPDPASEERIAREKDEHAKRCKAREKERQESKNRSRVQDVLFDQIQRVAALPELYPIEASHMLLCIALMKHDNWSDETLKKEHSDIAKYGLETIVWTEIAHLLSGLRDTKELTWAMKELGYDYKDMLKNIDALEEEAGGEIVEEVKEVLEEVEEVELAA